MINLSSRIVIFIGPEGSGKSTMAKRLAEESGQPYISTGNIIRDLAANDEGPLGQKCREMFERDTYLSGETLMEILCKRLSQTDATDGFVLDGGLRTLEETIGFKDMLLSAGRGLPATVVYLKIPKEESLNRLVNGENARKRDRDTVEGVESRLKEFYTGLERRLDEIKKHGWEIKEIDADKPEEAVYTDVKSTLV